MFNILADTLRTVVSGSKQKHQRLSYNEWEHRFTPRHKQWQKDDPYRFNIHRDLW